MKLCARHFNHCRKSVAGFTLIEMLTAVFVGLILLVGVAILYINGNESFVAMANYQNLDKNSTSALDILSREIRNASAVTACSAATGNQFITLNNATLGRTDIIRYSNSIGTLNLSINGVNQVLLTGCDSWSFSNYNRAPNFPGNNITFNLAAGTSDTKLIQMNWKCSRTILGAKITTESVQTAQVVLRNKTQ